MTVYLLRHGRTAYNEQRRYQGSSDPPLSPAGAEELRAADFSPDGFWSRRNFGCSRPSSPCS